MKKHIRHWFGGLVRASQGLIVFFSLGFYEPEFDLAYLEWCIEKNMKELKEGK